MIFFHFGVRYYPGPQNLKPTRLELSDSVLSWLSGRHDTLKPENIEIVPFNPNKISFDSLVNFGLNHRVAGNLVRYREAGGRFDTPKDLKKIYGMTDSVWIRLAPWIEVPVIEQQKLNANKPVNKQAHRRQDLNQVDSLWLKRIRGIGPVLSSRIIKYRELLGGFTSSHQLKEVYGLSPEVINRLFQQVYVDSVTENKRKININLVSQEQLSAHPYISFTEARAIISYREQHGNFENIEDLKNIHLMGDSTYLRVSPYLDF